MSTNPWDEDFTPAAVSETLIKDIQGALAGGEQAVAQAAENVVPEVTQAAESAAGAVIPTVVAAAGGSSIPQSTVSGVPGATDFASDLTTALESVIGSAAKSSAEKALIGLAPILEAELAKEFQAGTNRVIGRVTGGTNVAPTPNLEDFIHADARSRAFRSLLIGLVVAILTGLGVAAGQLVGADWSTHNGQVAAITVAVGAVVNAVLTYFTRLVNEPQVTKPLTAQLPSKASTV
jgi:hypothetical protein